MSKYRLPAAPAGSYANVPFAGIEKVPEGSFGKPARRASWGPVTINGKKYTIERMAGADERLGSSLAAVVEEIVGRELTVEDDVDALVAERVGKSYDLVVARDGDQLKLASIKQSQPA